MFENNHTPVTAGHYSLIRMLMGSYLMIHFLHLLPYGAELFSSEGLLPAQLSPLLGIISNPLSDFDTPMLVAVLLITGAVCGICIAIGWYDRIASIVAAVILGWLYARNPLIANPSLPVVGWMLVAHAFLPTGAYGAWSSKNQPERWLKWFYPRPIWIAAWILLAVAYSYSGYTKLLSPSWVDGSAINLVLENPLARDHFIRNLLLELPPVFLKLLTWSVLIIELLFVLFCFSAFTRKWAWLVMFAIQFGFLTLLNFADLTFPMLLIHALTFDRRWVDKYRPQESAILFYDGTCAFCSGLVRFALSEDVDKKLQYSPLQGSTFQEKGVVPNEDDSIAVLKPAGETLYKSDAAIHCLEQLGGVWLILGKLMKVFPRAFRNTVYDFVGNIRYRLAGKVDTNTCQLLPGKYAEQMLP
ncbi:MAG: DCC1-like thiol-disulfide oxidoreductase family protein [Gammaproteobacteria bacterium]